MGYLQNLGLEGEVRNVNNGLTNKRLSQLSPTLHMETELIHIDLEIPSVYEQSCCGWCR